MSCGRRFPGGRLGRYLEYGDGGLGPPGRPGPGGGSLGPGPGSLGGRAGRRVGSLSVAGWARANPRGTLRFETARRSRYLTISFRLLSGWARTTVRAGFALIIIGSPVAGLRP